MANSEKGKVKMSKRIETTIRTPVQQVLPAPDGGNSSAVYPGASEYQIKTLQVTGPVFLISGIMDS